MNIYQPFVYLVRHRPSGKVYYGSKTSKNTNPSALWKTYFTSSKYVKQLIDQDGVDAFDIEIRRVFNTAKEAHDWESKVLRRMKVRHDVRWINKNDCLAPPTDTFGKLNPFYGRRHSNETKQHWSSLRKGVKNPAMADYQTGRKHSIDTIKRRSDSNSKTYYFTDPNGNPVTIVNLYHYSKDNGLDSSAMCKVYRGKLNHHKGYIKTVR